MDSRERTFISPFRAGGSLQPDAGFRGIGFSDTACSSARRHRLWMLRSWESASPVSPSDWSARPSVFSQAKNRCISFAVSLFSGI